MNNYTISVETLKFNSTVELDNNLWILDKEGEENQFDRTSIISIVDKSNSKMEIRVDWCNLSNTDTEFSTLLIPETNKLFFGARFIWGIINLENMTIDRQEYCHATFWMFERHIDAIVVIEELSAKSLTLEGKSIHEVPIDPPFESENYDNRIEFDSPVYGKQTLNLI